MILEVLKKPTYTSQIEQPKCKECESINLIHDYDIGEVVCGDCGIVNENILIDEGPEWRAFDKEQREKRTRIGDPPRETVHDRGMPTMVGYYNENQDIHGKRLNSRQKSNAYVLRKWQKRVRIKYATEKNKAIALGCIEKTGDNLNLPKFAIDGASIFYRKLINNIKVKGRSIEGLAAASLYYEIRELKIPRTLEEVAKKSNVSKREIGRDFRFILRNLDYPSLTYETNRFISQYIGKLNLNGKVEDVANKIMNDAKENKIEQGRGPKGMSAASVYIASILTGERRTQREIAEIAGVTEVTIRNTYKDVIKKLGLTEKVEDAAKENKI